MLLGWCRRAMDDGNTDAVCLIRAHLGHVFKDVPWTGLGDDPGAYASQGGVATSSNGRTSPYKGDGDEEKDGEVAALAREQSESMSSANGTQGLYANLKSQLFTSEGLAARTLLCTQVYLTASYRFDIGEFELGAAADGRRQKGERKMENGKWKMENGKWKMENGKWK